MGVEFDDAIYRTSKWLSRAPWAVRLLLCLMAVLLAWRWLPAHDGGRGRGRGRREGFAERQSESFVQCTDTPRIYDDFYADVYDHLVYNNAKDAFEVEKIVEATGLKKTQRVLDVGCGTGHHVAALAAVADAVGVDVSRAMVEKARGNYPALDFTVGDATQADLFAPASFSVITCLYFTIYYLDKPRFFANCARWLRPAGFVALHLVDRDDFDPILPPGNPLLFISPQRYAKKRITTTRAKFEDFAYSANFDCAPGDPDVQFTEKFRHDATGKTRKNVHHMRMEQPDEIIEMARQAGLVVRGKYDMVACQYEYQYLYILQKA